MTIDEDDDRVPVQIEHLGTRQTVFISRTEAENFSRSRARWAKEKAERRRAAAAAVEGIRASRGTSRPFAV